MSDPDNLTDAEWRASHVAGRRLRARFDAIRAARAVRAAEHFDVIPPNASTTKAERNEPMSTTRADADDRNASFEDGVRIDTTPDDPNDPIVAARAKRDARARDAWRGDASEGDATDARTLRRDALRIRLGDPAITKREIDEVVRARGGDPDLESMQTEGIRQLLADVRKRIAAAAALASAGAKPNMDHGDDADIAEVERARATRDAEARDAWKRGR